MSLGSVVEVCFGVGVCGVWRVGLCFVDVYVLISNWNPLLAEVGFLCLRIL